MSQVVQDSVEVVCDREQCRWLGMIEPPNKTSGAIFAGVITTVVHLGCLPLVILSPLTFPLIFLKLKARFGYECPACRRGRVVPTDTERGRALKDLAERPRGI